MSHFTVLVIGDDYEKQLAPYHEFECTGVDDEFVQDVDMTDEARKEYVDDDGVEMLFAEWCTYAYGWERLQAGQKPDGAHTYGYVLLDARGDVVKCVDRTNPNAKWDWYVLGGRWCGFFPLKAGKYGLRVGEGAGAAHELRADPGTADQVRLGNVDFDRARDEAAARANKAFDVWEAVFTEHGKARPWADYLARTRSEDAYTADRARADYGAQPAIVAARKLEQLAGGCPVEKYGYDRAALVQRTRDGALVPFAVVKDGEWHERGSMGWWGCVSDETDPDEWARQVKALYDSLPPDTVLSLVDCHI